MVDSGVSRRFSSDQQSTLSLQLNFERRDNGIMTASKPSNKSQRATCSRGWLPGAIWSGGVESRCKQAVRVDTHPTLRRRGAAQRDHANHPLARRMGVNSWEVLLRLSAAKLFEATPPRYSCSGCHTTERSTRWGDVQDYRFQPKAHRAENEGQLRRRFDADDTIWFVALAKEQRTLILADWFHGIP
jgi:hypothetical protein